MFSDGVVWLVLRIYHGNSISRLLWITLYLPWLCSFMHRIGVSAHLLKFGACGLFTAYLLVVSICIRSWSLVHWTRVARVDLSWLVDEMSRWGLAVDGWCCLSLWLLTCWGYLFWCGCCWAWLTRGCEAWSGDFREKTAWLTGEPWLWFRLSTRSRWSRLWFLWRLDFLFFQYLGHFHLGTLTLAAFSFLFLLRSNWLLYKTCFLRLEFWIHTRMLEGYIISWSVSFLFLGILWLWHTLSICVLELTSTHILNQIQNAYFLLRVRYWFRTILLSRVFKTEVLFWLLACFLYSFLICIWAIWLIYRLLFLGWFGLNEV